LTAAAVSANKKSNKRSSINYGRRIRGFISCQENSEITNFKGAGSYQTPCNRRMAPYCSAREKELFISSRHGRRPNQQQESPGLLVPHEKTEKRPGWSQVVDTLSTTAFTGQDGKYYLTDCADKKNMNLIIQAIPLVATPPLLRRKRYNIRVLERAIKQKADQKCKNPIGSCRHAAAENQPIPRRESPAAARARKKAQDAKSASLHSAELWARLHRTVHPILKTLYC